jgi:hypothetical protein
MIEGLTKAIMHLSAGARLDMVSPYELQYSAHDGTALILGHSFYLVRTLFSERALLRMLARAWRPDRRHPRQIVPSLSENTSPLPLTSQRPWR